MHRTRYLAIYELTLEALRRPALRRTLARIVDATLDFTIQQYRDLGLATTRDQIRTLSTLLGGTLFTLVTSPPGELPHETTRALAQAMVTGTTEPR